MEEAGKVVDAFLNTSHPCQDSSYPRENITKNLSIPSDDEILEVFDGICKIISFKEFLIDNDRDVRMTTPHGFHS